MSKKDFDLHDYIQPDPNHHGSMQFASPGGFTGQGSIWFTNKPPAGWLICDGSLVEKDKYPALWLLLGDDWGTSTDDEFYIPDLRQRVPVGRWEGDGTFGDLNNAGGSKEHTLLISEMPTHNHNRGTIYANVSASNPGSNMGANDNSMRYGNNGSGYTNDSAGTGDKGGGNPHNILQPYRVVNFIIKT